MSKSAMRKLAGVIGFAVATVMSGVPAWAIPIPFSSGSFVINANTTTHTDVTTTTSFALSPATISLSGPTDDFLALGGAFPASETVTTPLIFTTPGASTFDFTDAAFGNFAASTVTYLGTFTLGPSVTVSYSIGGLFTLGTDWTNSGVGVPASETWSLTQTGGHNKAISMSGTFFADIRQEHNIPEPLTLSLLGAGLAGLGAVRRRRKTG